MSFPIHSVFYVSSLLPDITPFVGLGGPQARGRGSPGGVLGGSTVPARGNP